VVSMSGLIQGVRLTLWAVILDAAGGFAAFEGAVEAIAGLEGFVLEGSFRAVLGALRCGMIVIAEKANSYQSKDGGTYRHRVLEMI
jgi:hypothetical protein